MGFEDGTGCRAAARSRVGRYQKIKPDVHIRVVAGEVVVGMKGDAEDLIGRSYIEGCLHLGRLPDPPRDQGGVL